MLEPVEAAFDDVVVAVYRRGESRWSAAALPAPGAPGLLVGARPLVRRMAFEL